MIIMLCVLTHLPSSKLTGAAMIQHLEANVQRGWAIPMLL